VRCQALIGRVRFGPLGEHLQRGHEIRLGRRQGAGRQCSRPVEKQKGVRLGFLTIPQASLV
jgi:hypothetical protein